MLHFICKSRSQSLEEERRDTESMLLESSVKFPQSVMVWAAMSSAGVGPLCFLKSTVNADIYQEDIVEHFMLSSADKLYGDADYIFQQDLAPATLPKVPKAGSITIVLLCLIGQQTRLTWSPDNLWLETSDPTMQMTWRTWASLHLSSATDWLSRCHAALMQ